MSKDYDVHEEIESIRRRIQKGVEANLSELELHALAAGLIYRRLDGLYPWGWGTTNPYLSLSLDPRYRNGVGVGVEMVDAFAEALPVQARLADLVDWNGHSDHPESRCRVVSGRFKGADELPDAYERLAELRVTITIRVHSGSEVCKLVETGETKPVLKFACPGDADYPTQEGAV